MPTQTESTQTTKVIKVADVPESELSVVLDELTNSRLIKMSYKKQPSGNYSITAIYQA